MRFLRRHYPDQVQGDRGCNLPTSQPDMRLAPLRVFNLITVQSYIKYLKMSTINQQTLKQFLRHRPLKSDKSINRQYGTSLLTYVRSL